MKITEIIIDNVKGAGAVPYNADVDYFGLKVLMKPSTFLSLALPLSEAPSKDGLKKHIKDGGSIGAPFLDITVPPEWDDKNFKNSAKIQGHEGRNRMSAVLELEGDSPIEVHLFFKGYRARNITPEMISKANEGLFAERSTRMIHGPLFKIA